MKKSDKIEIGRVMALITQLGMSIVIPIIIGVYLGKFLDEKLNTGIFFTMTLIILGAIFSFYAIYKLGVIASNRRK